jgi:hypothetical protein
MTQKNEVLAREDNRIALISTKRTPPQEDCAAIAETEISVNTTEQTCVFDVGEEIRVGRTRPRLLTTLARIIERLKPVGSAKIDDSHLEARHNIHHNFRANDIRF